MMPQPHDLVLDAQRQAKDRFFKTHPQSPLTPAQQQHFEQLRYFDFNPALRLTLKPTPFAEKANVKLLTTKGETRYYVRWGQVAFEVDGQPVVLTLFLTPGSREFFIPFKDATSGKESYAAGRYLEAELQHNGDVALDFNLAYSPYCAYNEPPQLAGTDTPKTWSCPIPPAENRLTVALHAGEMAPQGQWVDEETDH